MAVGWSGDNVDDGAGLDMLYPRITSRSLVVLKWRNEVVLRRRVTLRINEWWTAVVEVIVVDMCRRTCSVDEHEV